ncbi:hypothetical protein ACGTI2_05185 [Morganella morganii]|uniref:hypothetical protein n=1 Tax=Morganella morganii TaxID=582 RepID=UPI003870CFA7
MARYRIGNRFLSQSEYDSEMGFKWGCILFVAGAIFTGMLIHFYLIDPEWHKAIRFFIITVPSILVGTVFVLLRNIIAMIFGVCILLALVAVVIKIILSVI